MEPIKHIVILGAGNVGSHLSKALLSKGFDILQVYNRTEAPGRQLAGMLGAGYTDSIRDLIPDADLYLLSVSDSALPFIADQLRIRRGIVVHTSGSVGMQVLKETSPNKGVFYPLQTFRKGRRISFKTIPVCIEGSSEAVEESLVLLARALTDNVQLLNSEQRRMLHLTAVFAGNFTNYLYAISEDLLAQYNIPFELLKPLILQTAQNARHADIFSLQTGPAVREDLAVMEQHLELLENQSAYKEIYDMISKKIIQHKQRHGKL